MLMELEACIKDFPLGSRPRYCLWPQTYLQRPLSRSRHGTPLHAPIPHVEVDHLQAVKETTPAVRRDRSYGHPSAEGLLVTGGIGYAILRSLGQYLLFLASCQVIQEFTNRPHIDRGPRLASRRVQGKCMAVGQLQFLERIQCHHERCPSTPHSASHHRLTFPSLMVSNSALLIGHISYRNHCSRRTESFSHREGVQDAEPEQYLPPSAAPAHHRGQYYGDYTTRHPTPRGVGEGAGHWRAELPT